MAEEPEDDRWLKLLSVIGKEGRKWAAALRDLATLLRQEALERRTESNAVRADDRARISRVAKQLKALDDRFGWIEKEMEENGSRS